MHNSTATTAITPLRGNGHLRGSTFDESADRSEADPLKGFVFDGDVAIEPPRALVKNLIPFDGICFIGGQSGAGKTFIVCDLAVCLASGEPFFERKVVERVGVVILAAEGASTIANRIYVARNKHACKEALPIAWLGEVPNLAEPKEVRAMIRHLKAIDEKMQIEYAVRLGAIICDTLAATFALVDENNNSEATKVCRNMRVIADATGTVIIPVHHFGKAAETGLRGASAWRANCDTVISVLAERNQITGKVLGRSIALAKSRVGEEGVISGLSLRFVKLGKDDEGQTFGSCCVEPCNHADEVKAKSRPTRVARAYMDALKAVIRDKGVNIFPFGPEGPEVRGVDRGKIRDEFYHAWPTEGDTEEKKKAARQKSFKRGEAEALERCLVRLREVEGKEFVWANSEAANAPF